MRKIYFQLIFSACVLCFLILGFIKACRYKPQPGGKTTPCLADTAKTDITIPGDSIPYLVYAGQPAPDTVYDTQYLPAIIDTAAILAKFWQVAIYIDTLTNDTGYLLVIHDTLTQNRIAGRSVMFQNLRPQAVSITTIRQTPISKYSIYIGGELGGNKTGFKSLAPSALLTTPKGQAYSIGYNFIDNTVQGGVYFKLK